MTTIDRAADLTERMADAECACGDTWAQHTPTPNGRVCPCYRVTNEQKP